MGLYGALKGHKNIKWDHMICLGTTKTFSVPLQCTLMLALLDFTLSSRQALQQTVVFPTVSVTWRILFPVCHTEAVSPEAVSVLWVGGRGEIGC